VQRSAVRDAVCVFLAIESVGTAGTVSATTPSGRKRCVVVYATRHRQHLWTVDLPAQATIADALAAARRIVGEKPMSDVTSGVKGAQVHDAGPQDVPWETAPVGIFGELRDRRDVPADGDRVEIYRPLRSDPRERRRERVKRDRRTKPV
jgi:putative ubiquitin-RnfH superfamily antitoxin RatB of RatAB toxin-antitoxin module